MRTEDLDGIVKLLGRDLSEAETGTYESMSMLGEVAEIVATEIAAQDVILACNTSRPCPWQ